MSKINTEELHYWDTIENFVMLCEHEGTRAILTDLKSKYPEIFISLEEEIPYIQRTPYLLRK